jgi:hypothetical protein
LLQGTSSAAEAIESLVARINRHLRKGRTSFFIQGDNLTVNDCIPDIECSNRISDGREFASKVPFVSRKDSRLTAAAQRKSAITVELNFLCGADSYVA